MDHFPTELFCAKAIETLTHKGIKPDDAIKWGLMMNGIKTGWIEPDGTFWANNFASHSRTAYMLGFNCTSELEKLGWVHVGEPGRSDAPWVASYRLTPAQRSVLIELGHTIDNADERMKSVRQPENPDPTPTPEAIKDREDREVAADMTLNT